MLDSQKKLFNMIQQLDPALLPNQYKELIDLIGLQATIILCDTYGGNEPYIPTLDRMRALARKCCIQREYDGRNTATLAKRFGVSTRTVRNILAQPMIRVDS